MDNDKHIAQLLDKGIRVYSAAAGRVGVVIRVDSGEIFPVVIKFYNGRLGCTTFDVGDTVRIRKVTPRHYRIENDARTGTGKYEYASLNKTGKNS